MTKLIKNKLQTADNHLTKTPEKTQKKSTPKKRSKGEDSWPKAMIDTPETKCLVPIDAINFHICIIKYSLNNNF